MGQVRKVTGMDSPRWGGPSHRQHWQNKDLGRPQGDLPFPSILLVLRLDPLTVRITGHVVRILP